MSPDERRLGRCSLLFPTHPHGKVPLLHPDSRFLESCLERCRLQSEPTQILRSSGEAFRCVPGLSGVSWRWGVAAMYVKAFLVAAPNFSMPSLVKSDGWLLSRAVKTC